MQIKRSANTRVIKAILHRISDIPGGKTVSIANLGGAALAEATPLCAGSDGMLGVLKTGKVVTAYVNGTSLEITKGTHFKVGDKIANESGTMYSTITAIDKTNAAKDVLTLSGAFSSGMAEGTKIVLVAVVVDAEVTHDAVAYGAHATITVTEVKIDKGHNIVVGDIVAGTGADPMTGKTVLNIDRGNDAYDVLQLSAQIGKAIADNEEIKTVTEVSGVTEKTFTETTITKQSAVTPAIGIAGSNMDVEAGSNLFSDVWLHAVVNEANAPAITDDIKAQLKGVIFV